VSGHSTRSSEEGGYCFVRFTTLAQNYCCISLDRAVLVLYSVSRASKIYACSSKKERIMIMGDSRMNSREANEGAEQRSPRRPYVKPAFSWERVFETRALACGKASGGFCATHGGASS
jgi:hypothetical protein